MHKNRGQFDLKAEMLFQHKDSKASIQKGLKKVLEKKNVKKLATSEPNINLS